MIIGTKSSKKRFLKVCPGCGSQFWARANAIYHDESCRKQHKYPEIKARRDEFKNVTKVLGRMTGILRSLLTEGQQEAWVSKQELLKQGFDFGYHTRNFADPDTKRLYYCCGEEFMWCPEGSTIHIRRIPN